MFLGTVPTVRRFAAIFIWKKRNTNSNYMLMTDDELAFAIIPGRVLLGSYGDSRFPIHRNSSSLL